MNRIDVFYDTYRTARRIYACHKKLGLVSLIRVLIQATLFGSAKVQYSNMTGTIPNTALAGLSSLLQLYEHGIKCTFDGADMIANVSSFNIRSHCKDTSFAYTVIEAFQFDEYKLAALDLRGKVVVDVGANIGDVALRISAEGADKVYCFEPVPTTYKYLQRNIQANNLENKVYCYPFGIGDRPEKFQVMVKPYASASTQMTPVSSNTSRKGLRLETIEINDALTTFQSLNLSDIYLLKIDCEGCEYQLLSQQLFDDILPKNIALEFHNGSDGIEQLLCENGYSFNKVVKSKNVGMIYAQKKC